ncbi:hypothetical protein [Marinigracilibium pacificum]|uniref:Uncharacterized protein n=1 Tax=Marinigracilibium pacificum TaxID=2729599 RepID=A0A848IVC7_9BACT|nr:hypothetical protein [Marinigracilibium pacificum]NMM47235.1 hypothetical protein [Marinigracilibium pacificum]
MKKLLINISLILFFVLLLNIIVRSVFDLPFSWGFDRLDSKTQFYLENEDNYNCLMIGSSRLYRQVDVSEFDRQNKAKGVNTNTFNFGVHTMSAADTYRVLDELSNSLEPGDLDYLIIELMNTNQVSIRNLGTTRSTFWYTPESFVFSVRSILNSNRSLTNKVYGAFSHTLSYGLKYANAGYISEYMDYQNIDPHSEKYSYYLGPNKDGYFPLMDEMTNPLTQDSDRKELKSRNDFFVNDTASVTEYLNISLESYSKQNSDNLNEYHLNYLNEIIQKVESKNIKVFILFPPRQTYENYGELLPILNRLPDNQVISISDANVYPQFYIAKYSFDFGHLNNEGSELFTKEISDKFINELNK